MIVHIVWGKTVFIRELLTHADYTKIHNDTDLDRVTEYAEQLAALFEATEIKRLNLSLIM